MTELSVGDEFTVERTFTAEDVAAFAAVSGDDQARHTERDDEGRLLVHGLLTATLATRIGSNLGVLARSMTYDFHRPVYAGETIRCEVEITWLADRDDGNTDIEADITCTRERDDEIVLTGGFDGLID